MSVGGISAISMLLSMCVATMVYPYLVKLAYAKRLVDVPNYRKLQKKPVPVIGGVGLYAALMMVTFLSGMFVDTNVLFPMLSGVTLMFFTGFLDDMLDLKPVSRFALQVLTIALLWYIGGFRIDTLAGFFGVWEIPWWVGFPLSLLAGVGLINALNMIDGVDGLASGLGISINLVVGVFFLIHGDAAWAVFAFTAVGALLPFLLCNVFSKKYKMFLGDSGSLILGTLAYVYTCRLLSTQEVFPLDRYRLSFALAVFAIPVFDTLRVMTLRILRHTSPFYPDKTHLHHILLEVGLPHVLVSVTIDVIYWLICLCWGLTALAGLSVTLQMVIMIVLEAGMVWGVYFVLQRVKKRNPEVFKRLSLKMHQKSRSVLILSRRIGYILDGKDSLGRRKSRGRKGFGILRGKKKKTIKISDMEKTNDGTVNYKKEDTQKILGLLSVKKSVKVEELMEKSGAEKLRVYPILFELEQRGDVRVIRRDILGAPEEVEALFELEE